MSHPDVHTHNLTKKVYLHIKPSGIVFTCMVLKSHKHTIKYEHYIHPAACSPVWCRNIIVICDNEKLKVSVACERDSVFYCDEEGIDHTSPSSLCELVCMCLASWELQVIHHVCLCSRAL